MKRKTHLFHRGPYNRSWALVASCLVVLAVTSCALGDSPPEIGSVTIRIVNASALSGADSFGAFVVPVGVANPLQEDVVALGAAAFDNTDSSELVLETPDPTFSPSGEVWIAEPGWDRYRLYVVVEPGGGNNQFDATGESANQYPSPLAVNGDTVVEYDYITEMQPFN